MKLSKYETEMLEGKHGQAKREAIKRLIEFGEAVGA
jgi:predicted aconitase